ncbi:MAG: HEPN domain-containing protein [Syntrophobacteraceae bacterium]|jgi:uncharacterized protein (UPF0332 family)
MNLHFETCLEKNRIFIVQGIDKSAADELEAAQSDLASARRDLRAGDYKWIGTKAYFAILHAGRSLLYSEGYKAKDWHSLFVALVNLFGERLSHASLNCLLDAWRLKVAAEEDLEYSKESAEIILARTEQLIKETQIILDA